MVGGHVHKGHIQLQGGIGQGTKQLQFRIFLKRHQVEDADGKRPDIL